MHTDYEMEPKESIFTEEDLHQYREATNTQRFINYLVDNLLMRYGLSYATGIVVGMFIGLAWPEYIERISTDPGRFDLLLLGVLIGYFNYLVYYTFCEKLFRGYTLGKVITGTRAIRTDGAELTFKDALYRSLSRMVPFEVLSGFSYPWHDTWTNTMVIKTR